MPQLTILSTEEDEEDAEREIKVAAWVLRQPTGVEGGMVGDDLQSFGVVILADYGAGW